VPNFYFLKIPKRKIQSSTKFSVNSVNVIYLLYYHKKKQRGYEIEFMWKHSSAAMMSTILSAVCPLEAAVIVSTESLYLLARQRQERKKGCTQVRGFQRFVSICSYATSTITAGYEWEQTRSNGLANRNPIPPHIKTTLRQNDISTAFSHRITAGIFNSRRRRKGVIWRGGG
jgi:hypothetical protein